MPSSKIDLSFRNFFKTLTARKSFLIILILGILVFFNSLPNNFVGDDTALIVNNPLVHSPSNIPKLFASGVFYDRGSGQANNYYKPLTSVTYSFVYSIFGKTPLAFHLLQILLHISNTILIFLIFKLFFKNEIALLLSLIFLVHPINAEAIVYISTLQDTLFLFFGLLALYLTTRDVDYFYIKSFLIGTVLLTLSIFSKESGVLFIIMIPIFNFLLKKRILKYVVQGAIAMSIYLFLRFVVAKIFFNEVIVVPIMTLPFWERIANIPAIISFYVKTFIYPKDLLILHAWIVKPINFFNFYLPMIIEVALLALLLIFSIAVFKKSKRLFRVLILFSVWFVIGLGIHLQIIPLDQTVADRWFYFPIIGLLGFIGIVIKYFDLNNRLKSFYIIVAVIILMLSIRTSVRNSNWKDNFTLYTHDIQANKDSSQLEGSVGYELFLKKDLSQAENHFVTAVELFPSSRTWVNLGDFYSFTNRSDKAEQAYKAALKYGDSAGAYSGLILLALSIDELHASEKLIKQALEKFPNYANLWGYLAFVKYNLGDKSEAIMLANKAYSLSGDTNFLKLLDNIKNDKKFTIH